MKLFYEPCGPMMFYRNGMLVVSDLNPEVATKWTMSRWEMFKLGWRCIAASAKT